VNAQFGFSCGLRWQASAVSGIKEPGVMPSIGSRHHDQVFLQAALATSVICGRRLGRLVFHSEDISQPSTFSPKHFGVAIHVLVLHRTLQRRIK
jgi:hypothetical protein